MSRLISYLSLFLSLFFLGYLFGLVGVLHPAPKPYPEHVHITIYIDRSFTDFEQESILAGALEWTETTNHIVDYDVVQLPTLGVPKITDCLYFVKITPDNPQAVLYDRTNKNTTLAFYDNTSLPMIAMISSRISNEEYKAVVMHEIGHSLGLEHNEGVEGVGSLMFPSILFGNEHITLMDGEKFCKLYHCDPKKLKYKEEPFHL